jgi:hypothetical protein
MNRQAAPVFKRALRTVGDRLLVESTCLSCGASETAPFLDGSIEDWEPNHRCVSFSTSDYLRQDDEDHPQFRREIN